MKQVTKVVLGIALAAALLLTLIGTGRVANVVQAQGPTPTAPAPTNSFDQSFWQALATRLGTTVEKLQQAVKDAGKDSVAEALKNNSITQAQADAMNQRLDQWQPGQGGPLGLPFGRGGFDHGKGGPERGMGPMGGSAVLDAAAKALGMTTADLTTELRGGKTLADVANAKNVSQDTVKQAIIAAQKAQVDQAQQAGRLTADQATQAKQHIDQESANLDLSKLFSGRGGPGGFGPGGFERGARPGQVPGQAPNQAPTTPTAPAQRSGA